MLWRCRPILQGMLITNLLAAQSGSSFDLQKRNGLDFIQYGKYDRAAAELEPVWEAGQQDPVVAENLAIAYLNGEERRYQGERATKAYDLMKVSLEKGGKASFLIAHSHERFDFLNGGSLLKFCAGRLSVTKGMLSYVSDGGDKQGEHSFEVTAADIREIKPTYEKGRGMFELRATHAATKKGFSYKLIPRTWDAKDTEVLITLLNQHVIQGEKQ